MCRLFLMPFMVASALLWSSLATSASADESEVIHLHLLGAGPEDVAVVLAVELQNGQARAAVISQPYEPGYHRGVAGSLQTDAAPVDQLRWDGERLQGSLSVDEAFTLAVDVRRRDETLMRGDYEWHDLRREESRQRQGEAHGMVVPLPKWDSADRVTLYFHNPVPGSPDGGRRSSDMRAIATLALQDGQVTEAAMRHSIVHAASRNSRQSIPVAMAGAWVGWQAVGDSNPYGDVGVSGDLSSGTITISTRFNDEPAVYELELQQVGDVLFGWYQLQGSDEHRNLVAGHWGSSAHTPAMPEVDAEAPRGRDQARTHLHWLATVNPYGGGLFGNDFGLSQVRNTGSKDYNDTPFVGGFGPVAARALMAHSDDPRMRAYAQMMALRAGQYILTHQVGPYNLMPTYKTKFRPQYWMGRGLIDLSVLTESAFWKERASQVGHALRETQDEHGSWSYVSASSGETGTTLSRNDRSWDHVPRANGMWLDLLARLRSELGISDYQDVEDRAAAWQREALLAPITHKDREYLTQGRSHRSRPDDDGPTFYALYQLRNHEQLDDTLFAATMAWAEMLLYEGDDRLLRASYHETLRGPPGSDTIGTMRMALIYALAAERRGDRDSFHKAGKLLHTVLSAYRPQAGLLWDSSVWDTPQVADWSGHAYTVLAAEVAVNMLELVQVNERLSEAGTSIPLPQRITFADIPDQPAEAARIEPGATADSGLSVRYEVDSGPASVDGDALVLSGEAGIVWVTAYQDGDDSFIPALSLQRTFAVGDAAPPAPTEVQTWSVNNRAVRVMWEPSTGDNIIAYTVEHSSDGGESWQETERLDADTRYHEIFGLENGEERLFRVRAHNPSFASKPSEATAGKAHSKDVTHVVDFAEVENGEHWDYRPDHADLPAGAKFVALKNKMRGSPDPAYEFWFTIEIDEPGRYDVHYYCWGNAGNNDSAFMRTGDEDEWTWISIGNQGWTWRQRGVVLDRPGTHTIRFGARQAGNDGPRIGGIVVTNTESRDP